MSVLKPTYENAICTSKHCNMYEYAMFVIGNDISESELERVSEKGFSSQSAAIRQRIRDFVCKEIQSRPRNCTMPMILFC